MFLSEWVWLGHVTLGMQAVLLCEGCRMLK